MSYQANASASDEAVESVQGNMPEQSTPPTLLQQKIKRFPLPPVSAETILKTFNTRSFKREQPENPELMLEIISDALAREQPVPFVLYWGKGPRAVLGEPELKCLEYLAAINERIRTVHPAGARITLIFTDTHAELNGHAPWSISSYFEALTEGATARGFEIHLLSRLMAAMDINPLAECARQMPTPELLEILYGCAAKWFRGDGTIEEGAIRYYQANMIEKQVVERTFPRSIFITFNGHEMRSLFPVGLPIFYMFSVRRGISAKPWFLPPDVVSHPAGGRTPRVELAHSS